MKSRDYWEKRAVQRKLQAEQQAVKTADEMLADYDRAAAAIRKDIGYWLSKFAENNALSLTDARKLLKADELEEFRWTVEEYIAKGKKNLDGRWERQLTNASARVHISRLEAMETVLRGHVEALTGRRIEAAESLLSGLYEGQYLGRAFDLQKGIGVGWDLQRPDLRKLDKVLKTPWAPDGELYSDRIWKDKQALVSELNASLTQGLATGKPLQKIADGLAERLSVKKSAARRLLYTEAAAVTTLAEKDCYRDLEVEEYEILATLDSRTSEICRSMDGQHFPVSEMEAGVNAPPFHPNCRTDTCPWFDDWEELGGAPMRAARDLEDKGYKLIPAKMTYREWEAEFVKEKADRIETARPEYDKLKATGLLRMPALDRFADMMYNQSEEYRKLQARYQNLTSEDKWSAVEFNPETVADHFSRHGKALGAKSQQDYNRLALEFLQSLDDKEVIIDSGGVRRVYSEKENLFAAVYPDGTVSTFFKPRQGRKYWEAQVKKYGKK